MCSVLVGCLIFDSFSSLFGPLSQHRSIVASGIDLRSIVRPCLSLSLFLSFYHSSPPLHFNCPVVAVHGPGQCGERAGAQVAGEQGGAGAADALLGRHRAALQRRHGLAHAHTHAARPQGEQHCFLCVAVIVWVSYLCFCFVHVPSNNSIRRCPWLRKR